MRYIRKGGNIPHFLEQSNRNPPTTAQDAESRWSSFKHKPWVSERLDAEQYGLCAYSEIRPDEEGLGIHLEHVRPKSIYPSETFDYHNIVLCALNDKDLQQTARENVFGGHAKKSQYDESRFVSCLKPDCQNYFRYLSDGRVVPEYSLDISQKENALYTVHLLNLNCEYLKNKRKKWIEELEEMIANTSGNDLEFLADLELGITDGKLRQFHSAAFQRFGDLGRKIIKKYRLTIFYSAACFLFT